MPEASPEILPASLSSIGQLFFIMPYWHIRQEEAELVRQVHCDGRDEFQAVLALGKGLYYLAPMQETSNHLGQFTQADFQLLSCFDYPE